MTALELISIELAALALLISVVGACWCLAYTKAVANLIHKDNAKQDAQIASLRADVDLLLEACVALKDRKP